MAKELKPVSESVDLPKKVYDKLKEKKFPSLGPKGVELSKLMDACGDDFLHLVRWQAGSMVIDGVTVDRPWEAMGGPNRVTAFGKTRAEAVANLYILRTT